MSVQTTGHYLQEKSISGIRYVHRRPNFTVVGPYRVRSKVSVSVSYDFFGFPVAVCCFYCLFSVISMYTGYGFFLLLMVCHVSRQSEELSSK